MPYSQIIALMVAFIFATGIPAKEAPVFDTGLFFFLWTSKTLIWAVFAALLASRIPDRQAVYVFQERLSWFSLVPFLFDFYVLDIKSHLVQMPLLSLFSAIQDIISIVIYFFYMFIFWCVSWKVLSKKGLVTASLRQTVHQRLILILPALIPFIVISVFEMLFQRLPVPWMESFQEGVWYQAAFFSFFILLFLFFIPPLIRYLWSCIPLPEGRIRDLINEGISKSRLSFSEILVWPLGQGNICTAAVLGLFPGFRYIMITPCLLENLLPDEIEAVIAHEVAHIRYRHIIWYLVFIAFFVFGVIQMVQPLWVWLLSRDIFINAVLSVEKISPSFFSFITVVPVGLMVILYFRFILGYFMRNFERQADLHVFPVQGHARHIISALEKVAFLAGGIRNSPSWHHFSVAERVDFLMEAERDKGLKDRFERNLFKKKMLFLVTGFLVCILPHALPVASWEKAARSNLLEISLEEVIQKKEKRPEWYLTLGNLLSEQGEYKNALLVYEIALKLSPDDPDVVNSIAWLYATSKDPDYRKPDDALRLSEKAAAISSAPHILDTYAEALFINGYIEEAIETEKEALKKDSENKRYYMEQITKFEKAKR